MIKNDNISYILISLYSVFMEFLILFFSNISIHYKVKLPDNFISGTESI